MKVSVNASRNGLEIVSWNDRGNVSESVLGNASENTFGNVLRSASGYSTFCF